MSIRARISNSYRWRIGIVGILALGFAAYCYYDGAIAYPAKQEIYKQFQSITDPDGDGNFETDWDRLWDEYAIANNLSTDRPSEISDWDIYTQYIMGVGCTVVGLFFFGSFLMMSRRFVETDDQAIWDHKGSRAEWDQITDIDKSRWGTKGIGVVIFNDGSGDKRIVLDDWKYDNKETKQIMAHVTAKTGLGVEPEPAEQADADDEADGDVSDEFAEASKD